ncbi:hypothetical protein Tco_0953745 [Tanacetum coccineum]|uniref:Uncharacterized protein n=1 Tax=Tanacetum coccineum TaxID=301880 RepID=A0ABQ5E0S4_9ASTR
MHTHQPITVLVGTSSSFSLNDGQIPGMSVVFQEKASLCFLRMDTSLLLFCAESLDDMITGRKDGSFQRITVFQIIMKGFKFKIHLEFSSAVIAMNSSNSEKISFSRRVPLMEWRILLPSSRRASKSSSNISRFHRIHFTWYQRLSKSVSCRVDI